MWPVEYSAWLNPIAKSLWYIKCTCVFIFLCIWPFGGQTPIWLFWKAYVLRGWGWMIQSFLSGLLSSGTGCEWSPSWNKKMKQYCTFHWRIVALISTPFTEQKYWSESTPNFLSRVLFRTSSAVSMVTDLTKIYACVMLVEGGHFGFAVPP